MKRSRFSEEQIIGIPKEQEAGAATADMCCRHGISSATSHKWKAKYGGPDVSEARRLKALEDENARLKKLLAESMLNEAALRDLLGKNGRARRQAGSCRPSAEYFRDERASGQCGGCAGCAQSPEWRSVFQMNRHTDISSNAQPFYDDRVSPLCRRIIKSSANARMDSEICVRLREARSTESADLLLCSAPPLAPATLCATSAVPA